MPRKKNKRKAIQAAKRRDAMRLDGRKRPIPNPPGIAGPGLGLAMAVASLNGLKRSTDIGT